MSIINAPSSGPSPVGMYQSLLPENLGSLTIPGPSNFPYSLVPQPPADVSPYSNSLVTSTQTVEVSADGAEQNYELVPLFCVFKRGELYSPQKKTERLLSHWHYNQLLIEKAQKRSRPRKGKQDDSEDYLPSSLNGANDWTEFIGYMIASLEQNPANGMTYYSTNTRTMTVQHAGEKQMVPNLWGQRVKIGDTVGFTMVYKEFDPKRMRTGRNWDDSLRKDIPTNHRALQVVPVICQGGNVPYQSTFTKKRPDDVHTYSDREEMRFKFDVPGLEIVTQQQIPLKFFPVGMVTRKDGVVSPSEIEDALEKVSGYDTLKMRHAQVTLQIMPQGKRFKWCL